ncbi:MAG: Hsp20/alpha crystallin family protein [Ectothiorhodospira sp.]
MWGMNLFENDLFSEFDRMRREMDQLLGGSGAPSGIRSATTGAFPPVNVGATPDRFDVYVFAPGMDPESLDISMQNHLLTVAGQRSAEAPEGVQSYRRERFDGEFRRVLTLPEDADPDRVEARYHEGVVHVQVQRRESSRPRRIEVH